MAKTIANFLVGIGLDITNWNKGGKSVDRDLDGFKTKAGIAGTAIAAAFSAASLAAINAGKRADEFALKFSQSDSSMKYAYNLGNAFKRMGADADQAYSAILTAEDKLDRLRSGDKGVFNDLALAGIAISPYTTASTGQEMIERLIENLPSMSNYQQRVASDAFGLDAAGMNALKSGEKLKALMIEVGRHSENLDAAAEAGRKFNDQMARAGIIMDGIGDKLAAKILPQFSELLDGFSTFLEKNMSKVEGVIEFAGNHSGELTAIGAGGGAMVAGTAIGALGKKIGSKALTRAATGASVGGFAGAAIGGGSLLYDFTAKDVEAVTGLKNVSRYYRAPSETVKAIGDWWRKDAVSPAAAASVSPEVAATRRAAIMSQQARSDASIPPPIRLENNLHLDGRVIAKTVNEVNALDNANAISDIQSSVSH